MNPILLMYYVFETGQSPPPPPKVHVRAGISCKGKTPIVVFEGKMNAMGYIEVLKLGLLLYLKKITPNAR